MVSAVVGSPPQPPNPGGSKAGSPQSWGVRGACLSSNPPMQKSFLRIAYVSSTVFLGVWLLAIPQSLTEAGQPPRYADVSLQQANERIMAFTLETPGYQLQQIAHGHTIFQRLVGRR